MLTFGRYLLLGIMIKTNKINNNKIAPIFFFFFLNFVHQSVAKEATYCVQTYSSVPKNKFSVRKWGQKKLVCFVLSFSSVFDCLPNRFLLFFFSQKKVKKKKATHVAGKQQFSENRDCLILKFF